MTALAVMTGFTEKCSTVGRSMLLIGTVYITLIYQPVYLVILMLAKISPRPELVYKAFRFCRICGVLCDDCRVCNKDEKEPCKISVK